ncbi:MAG: hypothetical protein L6Q57_03530 [Alphaproteobacteria bacterium]|nr:hypothetical protein [Alphaproteobacteria bacterium]
MALNFNDESTKPRFSSRANPLVPHAWQILQWNKTMQTYEPVGDYVLVDLSEAADITEKKLINLIGIMNGRQNLVDFTNLTGQRILFTIVPEAPETNREKIVFRTYDGSGVSRENAVLTLEKGVFT